MGFRLRKFHNLNKIHNNLKIYDFFFFFGRCCHFFLSTQDQRMYDGVPIEADVAINVRQPAAWALVNGFKNIENRNQPIIRATKKRSPFWACIVASKSKPSKKDMNHIRERMPSRILNRKEFYKGATKGQSLGGIVGMVRFNGSTQDTPSKWYNGKPDHGWKVDRSYVFESPIIDVKGHQGTFRYLRSLKNYSDVAAELEARGVKVFEATKRKRPNQKEPTTRKKSKIPQKKQQITSPSPAVPVAMSFCSNILDCQYK